MFVIRGRVFEDSLQGTIGHDQLRARQALVWMASQVGFSSSQVAAALALSPRSVRRLRHLPEEPKLSVAARTWLHLETLAERGQGEPDQRLSPHQRYQPPGPPR